VKRLVNSVEAGAREGESPVFNLGTFRFTTSRVVDLGSDQQIAT